MKLKKVKSYWNERWVFMETPVPTKKCDYYISDYGRIKSIDKVTEVETILKGSKTNNGYRQLNIKLQGDVRFSIYIHKYVAENYIGTDDEEKIFVDHIDRNKANNFFKNLRFLTRQELTEVQMERGVYKITEKRMGKNVKMTESKVRLLKKRLAKGKTKRKILAKDFGISTMQLSRIERGENWGEIQ